MWFMIQRLTPSNDTYLVNENSIKRISVGYRKFGPDQNENLYVKRRVPAYFYILIILRITNLLQYPNET